MTGHARDAIAPLEQALAAQPRNGAALDNLGLAHLMLGEFGEAERALAGAAAIPGAPAPVFMRLGLALLNLGRHADAVRALERALELDPDNPEIHLNLGQAAHHAGEPARARRHFDAALRLSPDHVDALFNIGVICLEAQQLDEARSWFERVMAHAPRHADAAVNLGIVLEKQQRLDDAIASFRRALELDPALAVASNNLAHALARQDKFDAAREQYRATLRLDPNLMLAHEGLASACLALAVLRSDTQPAFMQEAEAAARSVPSPTRTPQRLRPTNCWRKFISPAATSNARPRHSRRDSRAAVPVLLLGALAFRLCYVCDWEKWRVAWPQVVTGWNRVRTSARRSPCYARRPPQLSSSLTPASGLLRTSAPWPSRHRPPQRTPAAHAHRLSVVRFSPTRYRVSAGGSAGVA